MPTKPKLTWYQRALEIIALNAPDGMTIDEIADALHDLGWTGEALQEKAIRQGLSDLAISLIREA